MELRSCFISDQKLIKSSKEVYIYAEKIAEECSLLTSDLILAAVWQCLNQTDQANSASSYKTGTSSTVSDNGEQRTEQQNADRTEEESGGNLAGKRVAYFTDNADSDLQTHNSNCKGNIKKQQPEKKSDRTVNVNTVKDESESNTDKKHSSHSSHSDTPSGVQLETTFTKKIEGEGYQSKGKVDSDLKQTKHITDSVTSSKSKSEFLDKSIKMQSKISSNVSKPKGPENISVVRNVKNQGTLDEKRQGDQVSTVLEQIIEKAIKPGPVCSLNDSQSNEKEQNTTDIEVINIDDDEESNDAINEANLMEMEKVAIDKESAEDKEPDYFDMDCDEIDDDDNCDVYEQMFDIVPGDADKPLNCKEENNDVIDQFHKEDVTVISDDENDCEEIDIGLKVSTSSSEGESESKIGYISKVDNLDEKQINSKSVDKHTIREGPRSRRKQSITNVKEDFTEIIEEKIKEEGLNESLNASDVSTKLICSVVEHLDSMSVHKKELSTGQGEEKKYSVPSVSENETSSVSAVAVLGLVPVGDEQKAAENVVSIIEGTSSFQSFLTLASNKSIYVSSGMMHGSISSLPPVEDLHHNSANVAGSRLSDVYLSTDAVTSVRQSICSTPETFQFDQSGMQAQRSSRSQSSPDQLPGDELGSPPRKKRLLDYDKKWHMVPKYSPEQDKVKKDTKVKRKREHYSINEKLKIVARISSGESQAKVSRDLKIPDSTLRGWIKEESKLREEIIKKGDGILRRTKVKKGQVFETRLFHWIKAERSGGRYPNGPEIQRKALEMGKEMNVADGFVASVGWLNRFKGRFSIKL